MVYMTSSGRVPLDVPHLPERFGLSTLQVLGESIGARVAGLGLIEWESSLHISIDIYSTGG